MSRVTSTPAATSTSTRQPATPTETRSVTVRRFLPESADFDRHTLRLNTRGSVVTIRMSATSGGLVPAVAIFSGSESPLRSHQSTSSSQDALIRDFRLGGRGPYYISTWGVRGGGNYTLVIESSEGIRDVVTERISITPTATASATNTITNTPTATPTQTFRRTLRGKIPNEGDYEIHTIRFTAPRSVVNIRMSADGSNPGRLVAAVAVYGGSTTPLDIDERTSPSQDALLDDLVLGSSGPYEISVWSVSGTGDYTLVIESSVEIRSVDTESTTPTFTPSSTATATNTPTATATPTATPYDNFPVLLEDLIGPNQRDETSFSLDAPLSLVRISTSSYDALVPGARIAGLLNQRIIDCERRFRTRI